jgi:hypothetical protein
MVNCELFDDCSPNPNLWRPQDTLRGESKFDVTLASAPAGAPTTEGFTVREVPYDGMEPLQTKVRIIGRCATSHFDNRPA